MVIHLSNSFIVLLSLLAIMLVVQIAFHIRHYVSLMEDVRKYEQGIARKLEHDRKRSKK
jgi:hypothetical protein